MTSPDYSDDLYYVRPRLSEAEARTRLQARTLFSWLFPRKIGKVELCYLPHYCFQVVVDWRGRGETVEAAVDAVLGHFAFWQSQGLKLMPAQDLGFEIPFLISEVEAKHKLTEQYRWVLISRGLKLGRRFKLKEIRPGTRTYYPFWAGYYQARNQWNFEIVDAVTGMRQGGKVRDAFLAAWKTVPNLKGTPESK